MLPCEPKIPRASEPADGSRSPASASTTVRSATPAEDGNAAAASPAVEEDAGSDADAVLSGVVLDFDGRPVANAHVALQDQSRPLLTRQTDSAGRFAIPWVDEARILLVEAEGFRTLLVECQARPEDADVRLTLRMFRNPPPSPQTADAAAFLGASGKVTNAQGEPLEGVRVSWRTDRRSHEIRHVFTDASGSFAVEESFWEGLVFEHPDYAPLAREVSPGASLDVVLNRGGTLRARVLKRGQPVSNVWVAAASPALVDEVRLRTDEGGWAVFQRLPAGASYHLSLPDCPEEYTFSGRTLVSEGGTTDCRIIVYDAYPGTLRVRVRDAAGEPAKGAHVLLMHPSNPAHPRRIPVGDDGTVEVGVLEGTTKVFIDPGRSAEGGKSWRVSGESQREINVGPGALRFYEEFQVEEVDSVPTTVRFVNASGEPVRALMAYFRPGLLENGWAGAVTLDVPEGRINLGSHKPWRIDAFDAASNRVGIIRESPGAETTVRLDRDAGSIEGAIADEDGRPLAGVDIAAYADDDSVPFQHRRAQTDSQGRYRLAPLTAGVKYRIYGEREGYNFPFEGSMDVVPSAQGTVVNVKLWAKTAKVEGRVVTADGTPVDDAQVYFYTENAATGPWSAGATRSNAGGAFTAWLVPGAYRASASTPQGSSEDVTVTAPSSGIVLTIPVRESARPEGPHIEQRRNHLMQLGIIFKMFAGEHEGDFPPLARVRGLFAPDTTALYPEYMTDSQTVDYVTGRADARWCYTGYAIASEEAGQAFLDAYEQWGPEGLQGETFEYGEESERAQRLYPLKEGVERFFITDINDPAAGSNAQASLPVTWELPDPEEGGGWVLFMDGHAEWRPYPGEFPMNEEFIGRMRQMMSTPGRN